MSLARRCLLILSLALPLVAQAAPAPEELERGLVGTWRGALAYRDYQNDRRYELPVTVRVTLGEDGATLLRSARFDDGPATGFVHITTVSLHAPGGASVTHASFRRGRAVETWAESQRVTRHDGPQDWTLVSEHRGQDGGAPADIRITQTLQGDTLRSVKEVQPLSAPGAWQFRNETVLKRQP